MDFQSLARHDLHAPFDGFKLMGFNPGRVLVVGVRPSLRETRSHPLRPPIYDDLSN